MDPGFRRDDGILTQAVFFLWSFLVCGFCRAHILRVDVLIRLKRRRRGAVQAHELGLVVNAGHGINYVNIAEVRTLPHVHELNIGHSIVSRGLFTGIEEAVREMKTRMNA